MADRIVINVCTEYQAQILADGLCSYGCELDGAAHPEGKVERRAYVRAHELDDAAVESVMLDLLSAQVEIVQRFNPELRAGYMDDLRKTVRHALVKAFDADVQVVAPGA